MLNTPRRTFVKSLALVAASPFVGKLALAQKISEKSGLHHRILCCNIRVALPEDEKEGNGWPQRKALCISVIKNQKPDIFCLQEVLRVQNEDLKKAFPNYFSFGFEGPEMDTKDDAYHGIAKNPIFFSTDRYQLIGAGGFWLSDQPLIAGSMAWETARARNLSWVRLKDKRTGKDFRVVNLHLDHKSQLAKEEQMKLALAEAKQYATDYPQLLTGDLNSTMANPVYQLIKNEGWKDTYTAIHGETEPGFTVHTFKGDAYIPKKDAGKIDFIFTKGPIKAINAAIIKDHQANLYPSDHYFVSADIDF